jgi:hypothetical protein
MLEFIVGRLREEPFGIAIREVSHILYHSNVNANVHLVNSAPRVDFDGTTRGALRILNDVIGSLKPDLRPTFKPRQEARLPRKCVSS